MNRKNLSSLAILCVFLSGCGSAPCGRRHVDDLPPIPVQPQWRQIGTRPILNSTNGTFTTTGEFMERSIQSIEWSDKVRKWQRENQVP